MASGDVIPKIPKSEQCHLHIMQIRHAVYLFEPHPLIEILEAACNNTIILIKHEIV